MPRVLLVLALLLAGCRGTVLDPFDEVQVPQVEVHHLSADEPPVIVWTPREAEWVEVRHAETGRVVWRIEAAAGRPQPGGSKRGVGVEAGAEVGVLLPGPHI